MRVYLQLTTVVASLLLVPAAAGAQGHMLHGVGPINSSMAGAGAGLPEDSLAALMYNPALIGAEPGNQITFSTEFFKDGIQIDITLANGRKGHAEGTTLLGIIPAFGWKVRDPSKKLGLGFGLIGIAGFHTDYKQDTASIIFDKPGNGGFGRIFTDYNVTKIPVAFSFEATPKVTIGASLNVYRGNLAIAPLPFQVFDKVAVTTPVAPAGTVFYPEGGNMVGSWAIAGQFGIALKPMEMISIGASITTPQNFAPYEWNSYYADPTSPRYGEHRPLSYDLDGPLVINFGVGLKPNAATAIAIDGQWNRYKGVEGFGSPGGIVNGIVQPFGWRDILAFKAGVKRQVNAKVNVRAGYSFSQMPIKPENVLTATGAVATFQNHFTGGAGIAMFPFLTAEASFYIVPREHVEGPYLIQPGTIDSSNKLTSAIIGLNFKF